MDMILLSKIWNSIVESNTFNFIVFIAIFAWIFKKIDVKGAINSLHKKIADIINTAIAAKDEAKLSLKNAEKSIANLDTELKTILNDADKSAEIISAKILTEAEKQLESINTNAQKVIEAEEKMLIAKLRKSTSLASVEIAKSHIEKTLAETPSLHEKYINESIDELDRLSF